MKQAGVLLVLALGMISCQHTDQKIIGYIKSNKVASQSDYVIDLRDILGIEYDSMYLFKEYTNANIAFVIGKEYSNWREIADSHNRIILFKNGDIVYEDDFPLRDICFSEITERIDTTFSCMVHYGSTYRVENMIRCDNIHRCYRLNLEMGKYPQYYENVDSTGKQQYVKIVAE